MLTIDSQESGNAGHNTNTVGGSGSVSWSFTNTAGTLLVLGVTVNQNSGGTPTIGTPTYGGKSMVLGTSNAFAGNNCTNYFYYLINPPTGANTFNVPFAPGSGSPSYVSCNAGAISFTGANLVAPLTNAQNNNTTVSSSPATCSVPGTVVNDIVLAVLGTGTGVTSATSPFVESWTKATSQNDAADETAMEQATSPGGTMTASWTVSADFWAVTAIEVVSAVSPVLTPQACF